MLRECQEMWVRRSSRTISLFSIRVCRKYHMHRGCPTLALPVPLALKNEEAYSSVQLFPVRVKISFRSI